VFHTSPVFSPKFTTDAAGDITLADVFVTDDPTATTVGATNDYIATVQSAQFDHGALSARCQNVINGICSTYLFAQRGFVNGALGTWSTSPPQGPDPHPQVDSFTGTLPSGLPGTLSFISDDLGCTFDAPPRFIPETEIRPLLPDTLTLIDGAVDFTISNCTPGATVRVSMNYGTPLSPETEFWKAGDPWFLVPSSISGNSISFSITDGGIGDEDGLVNGVILDPGAAAIFTPNDAGGPPPPAPPAPPQTGAGAGANATATPVPALPFWALLALSTLLLVSVRSKLL